jgi:hypothetical protein
VAETLAFMRVRDTASLLGPAARGAARLLMQKVLATPRRVYIGAGVAALVAGLGANGFAPQIGRQPLLAPVAHDYFPASANTAAPAATVQPIASHASSTPISQFSTASAAARPAAGESRATQASAPDITSSIGPAAPDQIGALLRDRPVDGGSHLVRAAQIALAKLGYAVKPDGAEDGTTRRALRHFERAHGLALTTKISSELVKQLTAAAGG